MPRTAKQHNRNQRRWDADFMDVHCEYSPFECSTMVDLIAEGNCEHIDHMITQLRVMKRLIKRRAKLELSMPAWVPEPKPAPEPKPEPEVEPEPEEPKPEVEPEVEPEPEPEVEPEPEPEEPKPEPTPEPQEFDSDEDSSDEDSDDDRPVYITKPGARFGLYYKSKADRKRREKSLAEKLKIIEAENRQKARAERIRAGWGKRCHTQLNICRRRLDQAKSRTGKYWEAAVLWWGERVRWWDARLDQTEPPDIIEMTERSIEELERAAEDHNERKMEDKFGSNWEEKWEQHFRNRQRCDGSKPEAERVFREFGSQLPTKYTASDIKKAYRKLALVHHPDKGGDEAKFKRLLAAYLTLKGVCRLQI